MRRAIELLARRPRLVIIDTPGSFNELMATAIELATMVLLVTTMDIASVKDSHERCAS